MKFAIGEEEGVDCGLGTISIDDAFEAVSGALSSNSNLSEEVKGFDDDCSFPSKRTFFTK